MMDLREAKSLLTRLSKAYGVDTPEIIWDPRQDRLAAYGFRESEPNGAIIAVGDPLQLTRNELLHEFAHHLSRRKDQKRGFIENPKDDIEAHDRLFHERLTDVVARYYGDVHRYPWNTEYPHLRHPVEGLTPSGPVLSRWYER